MTSVEAYALDNMPGYFVDAGGDVLVVSVNAMLAKAPSDACTEAIVGDLARRFAARRAGKKAATARHDVTGPIRSQPCNGRSTLPLALVVAAAVMPVVTAAQATVRPLTEDEVRRAIPVLRVLAGDAEEARGERRDVEKAHGQAQRSFQAARGGPTDPVRTFRAGGGDRLVPPGFRIHEACSRSLAAAWGRAAVVATAGFSNDHAASLVGGCGPGGKLDPAVNKKGDQATRAARGHLERQGFVPQGPRLAGERFAASVTPGNCFRASPGQGCAALPSGPAVVFTEEAQLDSVSQAMEKSQAAEKDREARSAHAAEAAGFTPQELEDLRWALSVAREDARNPGRLEALAAMPGELGAQAPVRARNLAVYRKLEGEVGPLLEAIASPR